MRLKSYFADTIEEAIGQARRELGPEAMLMNLRRSGAEAGHLGMCEVVCEETVWPECAAETRRRPLALASSGVDRLSQDVTELKQQMERLALTLARSGGGLSGLASDPEPSTAFGLTEAEVNADLAFVSPLTYEAIGRLSPTVTREVLRSALGDQLKVNPQLGCGEAETCQVVETTGELAQAIEQHREKDLILIDPPGLAGSAIEEPEGMAYFLARYPGMETHLVLPASTRTSDLKRAALRFEIFASRKFFTRLVFTRLLLSHLLLSHLDETQTFGPIPSLSVRTAKPHSFLSGGQRAPEDLEPARLEMALDLVIKAARADESKLGSAAA